MKSHTYIASLISALLLVAVSASAAPAPSHLHRINSQIVDIKSGIGKDKQRQITQQQALKSLETHAAGLALSVLNTSHKLKVISSKINQLKIKAVHYADTIETSKTHLSNNLKAEYILNNQSQLKTLLSQNNLAAVEHALTYYHYLNKQRIAQINTLNETITLAQQNLGNLKLSFNALKQLQQQQKQQLDQITALKSKRSQLIVYINQHIHTQSQKLTQLLNDKHRLEHELTELSTNPKFSTAVGKSFRHLRHHLNWPTKGKIIPKYGTKIDKSQLKWKGVLFKARMNQPVYAVADGKVIFARWLPGYGLLMIIYHGQGYMTLYGRNHYLYKKAGDIVHAGDQIAAVGDSGGYQTPALYFAIRHSTKPINPIRWLKRS